MRAPVRADVLFPFVSALDAYPAWMPLIHDVEALHGTHIDAPAWNVELRARVGPFARSKRLRMERTQLITDRLAVFERRESDRSEHSTWRLVAEIAELADADADLVELTMTMGYDGALWAGPILERVLDEQVRAGRERLMALVGSGPPG
ncbi:MAG: SRPBCC family protein [Ilumatobacter sp.]